MIRMLSLMLLCWALAPLAKADAVLISFEEGHFDGAYPNDVLTNGFRLSPRCHFHIGNLIPTLEGRELSEDGSGCQDPCNVPMYPAFRNCNYAGSPGSQVRIDMFGGRFSFLSLRFAAYSYGGITITSSSGGRLDLQTTGGPELLDLTQLSTFADWRNIQWIETTGLGSGGVPYFFLDDLVLLPVHEPSSLWLVGLAVVNLLFARRRFPGSPG